MVDEARQKMLDQEDRKIQEKQHQKKELSQEMKETLDNQVFTHQRKLSRDRITNPEENSYSVIGDVFRDKAKTYDKRQYYEFLNYQEKEQNLRKRKANFMNDEEYKYNLNQLNVGCAIIVEGLEWEVRPRRVCGPVGGEHRIEQNCKRGGTRQEHAERGFGSDAEEDRSDSGGEGPHSR